MDHPRRVEAHLQVEKVAGDNDGRRLIVGRASTGAPDRHKHITDQQTLARASKDFLRRNSSLFWMHSLAAPIGRVLNMELSGDELIATAEIGTGFSVPVGMMDAVAISVDDIWKMIEQGAVNSFSLGFLADEQRPEKQGGPIRLMVTEVLELSVVTVPAVQDAQFNVAKAMLSPYGNDLRCGCASGDKSTAVVDVQPKPAIDFGKVLDEFEQPEIDYGRILEAVTWLK